MTSRLRRLPLEDVLVVGLAALATLRAEWLIVSRPRSFQGDALIHEFWMRRFGEAGLLRDGLTEALLETGYSPLGFRALYRVGSEVVDPVLLGELLPLVLQPLAVWLVFRIVREHAAWRPAAWLGAALFLVPWDVHRFSGGHPRAFAQPVVLAAVLLLLRRRPLAAALVPPAGALLYPPAGIVALAVVGLAALAPRGRSLVDVRRLGSAAASGAATVAALLVPRLAGEVDEPIGEAEARRYPEFGPDGQMHFFADSTLDYLSQNYSGFFLQDSGSLLAVAALLLLAARPGNARLLRWELWCAPLAALLLFAAAHALLFRLYLPHRYTYVLLPFFCIAIAVWLRPTVEALARAARPALSAAAVLGPLAVAALALAVFPLGPRLSAGELGGWLDDAWPLLLAGLALGAGAAALPRARCPAPAAAALVAGAVLLGAVVHAGGGRSPAVATCGATSLYAQLAALPRETVVAAEPVEANCIPMVARRPVVISRKLYQPWTVDYFRTIRGRMFATVRAFYGPSLEAVVALRERYGADVLVRRVGGREERWWRMEPFTSAVERLRGTVETPAVARLSRACLLWRGSELELYDLACVAREGRA